MKNIKPLGARVLVKRAEAEEVSSGGIIIADIAKEKPQEAEVIALGTGGRDEKGNEVVFNVAVGDTVLISKYGGTDIKLGREDYLLINHSDILGVRQG